MLNMAVKRYFIFLTILFVSSNIFAAASVRYTKAYGKNYVYLSDVAKYYGMQASNSHAKTVLFSKYSLIIFIADKKYCYINSVKVDLLFPAIKYKSYRCISSMDFLKTIDPIMRHWALRKNIPKTIVIDPGHGGRDNGASGKKYHEKTITLSVAQKVASLLKHIGYKVHLTRNSDKFIELKQRPALAKRVKADMFISIHANQADKKSVSGAESFCMTPAKATSTYSKKPSSKFHPGNKNDANNIALTYWIQRSLVGKTKAVDRGLKHARFAVLKDSSCPAVLIETGFLSNTKEEKLLGSKAYQWKVARGIVQGILRYHYQLKRQK
jgi:N-acetylmuramoyl-L-alanine amidase